MEVMKSYSIHVGINSYLINVNKSRRTFTMNVLEFDRVSKRTYRTYHGKSFVQSSNRFLNICAFFDRLERDQDQPNFDPGIDFYSVLQIFPDYN